MNSFSHSIVARALMAGAVSLVFMMASAAGVRAQTVIGAVGAPGTDCPDFFGSGCTGGDAGDGESVSTGGNPATAIGGNGGRVGAGDVGNQNGNGGAGGSATALATGSSGSANVTVSASAKGGDGSGSPDTSVGGAGGDANAESNAASSGSWASSSFASATSGSFGQCDSGCQYGIVGAGTANAMSAATSTGSGPASSSATATGGLSGSVGGSADANSMAASKGGTAIATAVATGNPDGNYAAANATANAETAKGALARAQSTAVGMGFESSGQAQSTALTSYSFVKVQSAAIAQAGSTATTNAIAQGGSGQAFANPGQTAYAFSTALPDKAYSATLIDGAHTVADALLGSRDLVFGTAFLGGGSGFASSTFDFAYGGDLILGLIDGSGQFSLDINGVQLLAGDFFDDSVINLGSNFGPVIDLTIVTYGAADFAIGGAVPEPSTWAMMLLGFAGLGFTGWLRSRRTTAIGLGSRPANSR